jgi:acetyl-CoA synthetase
MNAPANFRTARELLLSLRDDQSAAAREFRWPKLEHFNFALDHFDTLAADARFAGAVALHIVGEDGSEVRRSFAELAKRSAQLANHLRGLGLRRGDRVLLMLGNELALWETMLATIKLGAVVIPATSLLSTEDLATLRARRRQHVVAGSALASKFAR